MKSWVKRALSSVAVLAGFTLGAASVRAASILHTAPSPSVTPDGSNFDWDYKLEVTSGATVRQNDFVVIRDFAGYIGQISLPTNWSLTTELTTAGITGTDTTTAGFAAGTDSPSIVNLRFTYTGTTALGPGVSLGDFIVESAYSQKVVGALIAMDHSQLMDTSGNLLTSVNSDAVQIPVAPVPLPSTAAVGICLLGGLGVVVVLRRRAVCAA